jgi:Tfp pilus assembly protein PilO
MKRFLMWLSEWTWALPMVVMFILAMLALAYTLSWKGMLIDEDASRRDQREIHRVP